MSPTEWAEGGPVAVEIVKSVCPKDCFDTCGMLTHVADGKVVRVEGDPDHPITKGFLCGQFQHFEEFVNHPDRLLFPLMRDSKSEPFRRVGWDEALTAIADRFGDIIAAEGGQAILPYSYFGHMGLVSGGFAERLWNRMNTSRVGLEICALAGAEAFIRVFGLLRGCESYHLDKTQCHVIWGKNPIATSVHSHAMTKNIHPTIVIDPYRSDSALSADLYLQPKPATDSMLAMAVMRILIEREQIDKRFVAEHTTGFEPLHDKVMSISLEAAAKNTAVPASRFLCRRTSASSSSKEKTFRGSRTVYPMLVRVFSISAGAASSGSYRTRASSWERLTATPPPPFTRARALWTLSTQKEHCIPPIFRLSFSSGFRSVSVVIASPWTCI